MAYARLHQGYSDVYVYHDSTAYVCDNCIIRNNESIRESTPERMLKHLALHEAYGDKVPEECLQRLRRDTTK